MMVLRNFSKGNNRRHLSAGSIQKNNNFRVYFLLRPLAGRERVLLHTIPTNKR